MAKTSAANAGDVGSVLGRGAKIPHNFGPNSQNIKQKQYCNKTDKEFKYCPYRKIKRKLLKSL